ncbi:ATP-grasp fold amidoligase family protein [Halorubrum ezzemoulense]|uniref:ATP-grasp fold amidoligase family protein n=1 Tax=Halorubrum ezzemoulense TaxID=337243 RepID=UPI00232ECF89|nr:ATP-grasp fold amidoligase family protein [Halorubrum ezzemoulense]MDB2226202.1 ATP-grasp fold amidoligase family protein [Halorubrum ezzemoulense]
MASEVEYSNMMKSALGNVYISRAYKTLQKTGFRGLCKESWLFIWRNPPLSRIASTLFGEVTHEKIIQSGSLGYWPQIKEPRTFNEKIAYRKLFTDKDIFSTISDKYAVRDYVREKASGDILNDLYYVTDNPSSIPFDSLPTEFVIKSTHGSGHIMIIEDKHKWSNENIISKCETWLETEYGENTREYWYQDIEPRIVIERRIPSDDYISPADFKLMVFNGDVEFIQVNTNRHSDLKERFYDSTWTPMEFTHAYEKGPVIEKPSKLDEMIDVAESLGEDFDFVRVDLYQSNNKVIFGEITPAPGAGHLWFTPKKYDYKLGELWG